MTAASGDPGETPQNGGPNPEFPAYGAAPDPAYGPPSIPPYASYPPPPPQYGPPYPGGIPGYPGYPGYPPPPQPPGTNGLAIVALASSVLGLLCGLGSILGITLGLISIGQIKRTGQQGHALAVSAIVVGGATLLLSIVMWTYARNMT